ncbi:MAG: IclR family transcriptional regulator [Deltaproteobacteria bacterium]|nr:IclR family transcriptional regulator [Deltaproteobacteria bacterium]MBT4265662.1 IclR family transcriptional regulator [Deltaproteobacteria bacterium]MBT4640995.1 IclR family transcriptional regulator [Deltaproteobacteria bacterium]MBT6498777.1 IclR family transcriptional regulator [Deltaproteobacteria bacterium]MBT7154741.1 IclR family transcriptional regulator [Deltaproteobacteria bacterium]
MTIQYKAPSVKKAFQILEYISKNEQGFRVSELSRELNVSKSTVHGITSALEDLGVIERDRDNKRYVLGLTLIELGRTAFSRLYFREAARPTLQALRDSVHETVFLGVRNGNHVTIIDVVEGRHELRISAPIGTRLPLLAGAVGKILLSILEEDQALELIKELGLTRATSKTITDQQQYLRELRKTREKGVATDYEEYISGVRAVAAPLVLQERGLTAAIWVVGFKPNLPAEKMASLEKAIARAVIDIRQKIEASEKPGATHINDW